MEGAMEEWEESAESGTTSTQVDTEAQEYREHDHEPRNLQEPEGDNRLDSDACPGVVEPSQILLSFSVDILDDEEEEDVCISDTETLPQETLTDTNTQDDADSLSSTPLAREEELTHPSVSSHPSSTQNHTSEPCWYCLRSLDAEYRPETAKKEDSDPLSPLPSSGQKVNYQTDPRPHFGVAWSFHSTCRPLWGSEGPCWGQRNQEAPNQMHTCPHCHLGLPPDTLRWHEAKCLLFEGLRNSNK